MKSNLKIAIGTEAFPPTIDGISTVAKCYADIINDKLGEAVIVTPKIPIRRTINTNTGFTDTKAFSHSAKAIPWAGPLKGSSART